MNWFMTIGIIISLRLNWCKYFLHENYIENPIVSLLKGERRAKVSPSIRSTLPFSSLVVTAAAAAAILNSSLCDYHFARRYSIDHLQHFVVSLRFFFMILFHILLYSLCCVTWQLSMGE